VRAGDARARHRAGDPGHHRDRPRPARPARRVNHAAAIVTGIIITIRATCHSADPASPSSTATAAPSAVINAGSSTSGRGRKRT
jgi:hypothetical protein